MPRPKVSARNARERAQRATEWLSLRKDFLMTQAKMAEMSGIGRRTIQMVEGGFAIPEFRTQAKFLDLKKRLADEKAKAA